MVSLFFALRRDLHLELALLVHRQPELVFILHRVDAILPLVFLILQVGHEEVVVNGAGKYMINIIFALVVPRLLVTFSHLGLSVRPFINVQTVGQLVPSRPILNLARQANHEEAQRAVVHDKAFREGVHSVLDAICTQSLGCQTAQGITREREEVRE